MATLTRETYLGERVVLNHDFGLVDNKGRAVGARLWNGKSEFFALSPDATSGHRRAPGVYFTLDVSTTRAGAPFGASQSTRYFATEKERDAAAVKYLKSAAVRAKKIWGAK